MVTIHSGRIALHPGTFRAIVVLDGLPEVRDGPAGIPVEALAALTRQEGFARCKNYVDYDIGMKNFIQNGPRVPAEFMHE